MADEQNMENEATQLKRKAIRDLMFDKSLSASERTKQIQLIMSGKVQPAVGATGTQTMRTQLSAAVAAAAKSMVTSSVINSAEGNDDNVERSGQKLPARAVTFEDKLRAKMNEIKKRSSRDLSSTTKNESTTNATGEDVKPSTVTYDNQLFDDHLSAVSFSDVGGGKSSYYEAKRDDVGGVTIGADGNSAVELGTIDDDEDNTVEGTIGDNTLELGTLRDDDDNTLELGTIGDTSTVELATIGDNTVELGTIGDGEDSTVDGEDNTVELGTIGDESDLESLESKSSLTSRNWANRFRAAALEAKIAAKISKAGGATATDVDAELNDGVEGIEVNEEGEPSSPQGVALPTLQESTDDEAPVISRETNLSLFENPSDSVGGPPQFSDPAVPDGLAVATAVAPDDEPDYVFRAIEYDPDSKPPLHKNRRFRAYTYFALFLIFVAVVLVVVYATSASKQAELNETVIRWTAQPTPKATSSPTTFREAQGIIEQIQAGVLLRNENFEDMLLTDPRRLALNWILHRDEQRLVSDSINLYQRYGLAVLAYAMDSYSWAVCGNPGENFTETSCSVYSDAMNQTLDFGVWLSGVSECDWFGVTCSNDGIVRSLELISNDLVGVIPHELTALRFLQTLALAGNCIYGTIPEEIGQLDSLLSLELHENGLSGVMPTTIYQLEKLQLLNLAKQYGVDRICEQSNGTKVYINYKHGGFLPEVNVGLTGKLGSEVGKWRSMKGMFLSENSFTGSITEDIGNLRYLRFLYFNDNFIEGSLPTTITKLRNLKDLRFDDNFLYTSLPESISSMKDLERLSVNGNSMYGKLPEGMYELKKLTTLFLHDTAEANSPWLINAKEGFSGSLSSSVGNLANLEYLLLNNNPITGFIPRSLGNCTKLKMLRLHRTELEGSMPREVCLLRDKDLNNEEGVGVLYADCRPNNKTGEPRVQCDCCTDCCDYTSDVCVSDD